MKKINVFYQEPLSESLKSIALVLIFITIWSLFFSYAYALFIAYSPLIYINFIACFAFGISIAYGVKIATSLLPIFKSKTAFKIAIIASLLSVYFSWAFYMLQFVSESTMLHNNTLEYLYIFNPINWLNTLLEINNFGLWSLFGANFTGTVLWLIWLVEATIITSLAIGLNFESNLVLYSKMLNKKYQNFILDKDFKPMYATEEFKKDLFENCIETIKNLEFGGASYYAEISIFFLEREEKQYLSIENITSINSQSKSRKKVITHLQISTKEAQMLMQMFKTRKQSLIESFRF